MRTTIKDILLYNSCPIKATKYIKGPFKKQHRNLIISMCLANAIEKKLILESNGHVPVDLSSYMRATTRMFNSNIKQYDIKLTQEEINKINKLLSEFYNLNILSGLETLLSTLYMRYQIDNVSIDEVYPVIMKDINDTMHIFYIEPLNKTMTQNSIEYLCRIRTFLLCTKLDLDHAYVHIVSVSNNKINYKRILYNVNKDKKVLNTIIFNYVRIFKNMPKYNNWLNCNSCDFTCK